MNRISIVIPVWNSAAFLPACLDSVTAQTLPDLEILLAEDGSSDDSLRVCERYAARDPRVRLLPGPHRGVGAARNRGLDAASGDYVLFLDSDDRASPALAEKLAAAARPASLVLSGIRVTGENGAPAGAFREASAVLSVRDYLTGPLARWKSAPLCGGIHGKLYDLRVLRDHGLRFEEDASYAEDFCFNLDYLRRIGTVTLLPDLLTEYRLRPGSLTEENLLRSDFASLRQRRLEVAGKLEALYAAYGLEDRCASVLRDFRAQQTADMVSLSVRRAPDIAVFRRQMALLRPDVPENGKGGDLPAQDRFSLFLLRSGRDRLLLRWERARLALRRLRGRERF